MPRLSVFPKCYMDALCVTKTMTLFEWIDLAATLGVDGVEMYPGFFESFEPRHLERVRAHLERARLEAPMMCASPDFTQPDAEARRAELERERRMIDVTAALGGRYCRVLSGQRRDLVSRADGVRWTVECITSLLDTAASRRGSRRWRPTAPACGGWTRLDPSCGEAYRQSRRSTGFFSAA